MHNLTFDLDAYENDCGGGGWTNGGGGWVPGELQPQGFHLKMFGSVRHRYMALSVPKCESKLVRTLKVALDQSVSGGPYFCVFFFLIALLIYLLFNVGGGVQRQETTL